MLRFVVLAWALIACCPAQAEDAASLVAACDRLAASDQDAARPQGVAGVPLAAIDAKAAVPACLAAAKAAPQDGRVIYQLGRALQADNKLDDARKAYDLATSLGYKIAATAMSDGATHYAAIWLKQDGPPFVYRYGMTAQGFQQEFDTRIGQGWCLSNVSGYAVNEAAQFAAIFELKTCPRFAARDDMTASDFQQEFDKWTAQGYRPKLVSGYVVQGRERFAAIWEQASGPEFVLRFGLTAQAYQQEFDRWNGQGYCLTWISGYALADQDRYAAIWEKNGCPQGEHRFGMDATTLQREFDKWVAQDYALQFVGAHRRAGQAVYAAIWSKTNGPAWMSASDLTASAFQQRSDQLIAQGFRPTLIVGY